MIKKIKNIGRTIGAIVLAGALYTQTSAQESKPNLPPVTGNLSASIVSDNVLLSGKPESEHSMLLTSGKANLGSYGIFGGISQDNEEVKEQNYGLSFQTKIAKTRIGTLNAKITLEEKDFPDVDKKMCLSDLILSLNTKIGDASIIQRERFENEDYDEGRTSVLGLATKPLSLGRLAGIDLSTKATLTLAFQDEFVGKTHEFSYTTPGIAFNAKKGNFSLDAFVKDQRALREDLDDILYGGWGLTYSFGGKK
jgi:hypothetical protein